MIRAPDGTGSGPDDLATCLAKAIAETRRAPLLLTLSARPVAGALDHLFGREACAAIVRGAAGSPSDLDPTSHAIIARFVDAETFDWTTAENGRWLRQAAAIMLQFTPTNAQTCWLAAAGFTHAQSFTPPGRKTWLLTRPTPSRFPRPSADPPVTATASRTLVIVDPCLGRASGHYESHARLLTVGARELGLAVVWACHAEAPESMAPADVAVRRCFKRCFFDLSAERPGATDLSNELARGWRTLLAEFDHAGVHFIMHSADAHQLRALAGLMEERPPQAALVHVNFQTSPRFMPGRLAGQEAHAAVIRLRDGAAWERSLFFWAETRRLSTWMSDWLSQTLPALPLLVSRSAPPPPVQPYAGRAITVSFLGEARPTKGFLDLPDIVDEIAAQPGLAERLRLVIQNWPPFRGDPAIHAAAIGRLARHRFVHLVDGALDETAYAAMLDQADALLLPYQPETYNLQGSGVLAEGLARGAVILARAGTAMTDEGDAGVVFTYRSARELADGLSDLTRDFEALAMEAHRLSAPFRERNSPRAYVAALIGRSGADHRAMFSRYQR